MYLLDTNVISELRKPHRNPHVVRWITSVPADALYLSVVTVGEVAKGIAKQRRLATELAIAHADTLQNWLDGLLVDYGNRILPVDVAIATRWGRLCDACPQFATDMLLAATALDHGLAVVTRNVDHLALSGVAVVDPFQKL